MATLRALPPRGCLGGTAAPCRHADSLPPVPRSSSCAFHKPAL